MDLILDFRKLNKDSLPLVGGKNASLGEMINADIRVPPGFAVTTKYLHNALDYLLIHTPYDQETQQWMLKIQYRRARGSMEELRLEERFAGVRITEPVITEWGWLITYAADPAGVKLHFAEPHSDANKSFFNDAPWIKR